MSRYAITDEVKGDSNAPFSAGIIDNCTMTGCSYKNTKPDGSGKEVLMFEFQNSKGGTFRYIAWEVNEEQVKGQNEAFPKTHTRDNASKGYVKGHEITNEQAVDKAYDEFFTRIKHIMTKFMTDSEANIAACKSYEDFARKVVAKMDGKYKGVPLRLKVVYRGKYLNFPRFGNCVELMGVSPTKLNMTSYDSVKAPSADPEVDPERTAMAEASEANPDNDLPF